eukprot:11935268-Karenia_brevis.AAC.1
MNSNTFLSGCEWLDESTLPFLLWAYSTRLFELDEIIEENVPQFEHKILNDILNEFAPGTLKHVYTRPLQHTEEGQHCYHRKMQVFSPTDLGISARRDRLYADFTLYPFVAPMSGQPSFED